MHKKLNILIIGYGGHGKDTLADYFESKYPDKFKHLCSSRAAADLFIFDALKDVYGYSDGHECYMDRRNHREEWYNLITDYNKNDKARLARNILGLHGVNCYTGMRSGEEINACLEEKLFDLVIWVDASERLANESLTSCTVFPNNADIIISNNDSLDAFLCRADRLGNVLFGDNSHTDDMFVSTPTYEITPKYVSI